jgi:hypothetical protein
MPSTKLMLVTSELIEVTGSLEEIERRLLDAARSTAGSLAWLETTDGAERVGVNPAHVVTVRPGDD